VKSNPERTQPLIRLSSPRDNNYDLLRLILALMVIVSHGTPALLGKNAPEPLSHFLPGSTLGGVAVAGFFVISGYLVSASWCASTPLTYFEKRARRIGPGFIVACVATAALAVATSTNPAGSVLRTNWLYAIITTLTIRRPVVWQEYSLNPFPFETNASLWTIKYELTCYIGTAILGFLGCFRHGMRRAVAALFAIFLATNLILSVNQLTESIAGHAVQLGSCYVAGLLAYCFRTVLPRSRLLMGICAVSFLLPHFYKHLTYIVLPTSGAYCLLCLIYAKNKYSQSITRFGDLSYGLYLYGWPVEQGLIAIIGVSAFTVHSLVAATIVLCLLLAYLSYRFVEKPHLFTSPRRLIPSSSAERSTLQHST